MCCVFFSRFPGSVEAVFGNFLLNGRLPSCRVLNRSQGKKFSNLANRHSRSESKCSLQIDSFLSRHFQTSPSFKKDKFPAFLYDSIVNESISQSIDPKESRQLFSIEFLACVTGGIVCAGAQVKFWPRSRQPRSQGPLSSSLEKVPWVRLVTCLP